MAQKRNDKAKGKKKSCKGRSGWSGTHQSLLQQYHYLNYQ